MKNQTPDIILDWLRLNKGSYTIAFISKKININEDEVRRAIEKLDKDRFIDIYIESGYKYITISYDGMYFHGYNVLSKKQNISFLKEQIKFWAIVIGLLGVIVTSTFTIVNFFDSIDKNKSEEKLEQRLKMIEKQLRKLDNKLKIQENS